MNAAGSQLALHAKLELPQDSKFTLHQAYIGCSQVQIVLVTWDILTIQSSDVRS